MNINMDSDLNLDIINFTPLILNNNNYNYNNFIMTNIICNDLKQCYLLSKSKIIKYNKGDKIILPYSFLNKCNNIKQTDFVFQLTNFKNNKKIYVGVIDFICNDDIIFIPSWILTFLNINANDNIYLSNNIPIINKATSITIKSPDNILNPLSVLEYLLRNMTLLYKNFIIKDTIFDKQINFIITDIEPSSPALIMNIDINLNII